MNIGFCNLDIIPNSGITFLVKYGIKREKIGIDFANPFTPKIEVNILKHPMLLI